jgi:hypothetical protein
MIDTDIKQKMSRAEIRAKRNKLLMHSLLTALNQILFSKSFNPIKLNRPS